MLIEKLKNPHLGLEGYNCFGCSSNNIKGLHLDFFLYGKMVFSKWLPDKDLQGYNNILHGGIQATLLDELGAWWVYIVAETAGFTSRLSVRYHKGVSVVEGDIYILAKLKEQRRNLYMMDIRLLNNRLELCAHGDVEYFTFPLEHAMKNMYYSGVDAFRGELVESSDYGFPDALFAELA